MLLQYHSAQLVNSCTILMKRILINRKAIKFQLCRQNPPRSLAELIVKYRLDAGGLQVKDLVAERDFLAERLGIPEYLLQVLSWGNGSIVIIYWIVRDVLPLAEIALCREGVRVDLTKHGVESVYLDCHPLEHPDPVSFLEEYSNVYACGMYSMAMVPFLLSLQVDHSLQTTHCKGDTVLLS